MMIEILSYVIEFAIQTVFLLLALWFMVNIQKQQFTFLGLLGAAALASALDMIPYVGHLLSVTALLFCIMAVTRTDMMEVRFTVGISYALMFGMNLFLLGWLLGDLRVSARSAHDPADVTPIAAEYEEADEADSSPAPGQATNSAEAAPTAGAKSLSQDAAAGSAPPTAVATPPPVVNGNAWAGGEFALKGVTQNGRRSSILLFTGVKTYSLEMGETLGMETTNRTVHVRLDKVSDNSVELNVGGQPLILRR